VHRVRCDQAFDSLDPIVDDEHVTWLPVRLEQRVNKFGVFLGDEWRALPDLGDDFVEFSMVEHLVFELFNDCIESGRTSLVELAQDIVHATTECDHF